ncbi:MAG: class I SAM-dependent methyltransferase [Acidobacteriia bacterium]|nr:class I SAM-dependent methyltransferase [Terriglobia bacterium]
MRVLLDGLPSGTRVLDLGAAAGSFSLGRNDLLLVRADRRVPSPRKPGLYVAADAARLPFASASFDAVIANHSLEHFEDLEAALREVGRIVKPGGSLYVAVPDASTLTDRIYRWLGRGGGHVNAFRRPKDVIGPVERLTGLKHRGTRGLFSSLSFLNNHNFTAPPPKRIALFAFGDERCLAALMWILRGIDQRRGTRLSRYGWAFYFGRIAGEINDERWVNVCVRCGSGHSAAHLRKTGAARRAVWRIETYRCPDCGAWNLLSPDDR